MGVYRLNLLLVKPLNDLAVDLPSPKNISYAWNYGSSLGLFLVFQIATGLDLSIHYLNCGELAFSSMDVLSRDVTNGVILRSLHANGASFYFLALYLHMSRGIYFHSFFLRNVWLSGCVIFLLSMATAFLGYVLPWGNMSFWGATVITNFFSAIPYVGKSVVIWLWGGYSVGVPTLVRFYSLHFLLPFVIFFFVVLHIVFLHAVGSNNPLGVSSFGDKVNFNPYFLFKDLLGFVCIFIVGGILVLIVPFYFSDCGNFSLANYLFTPVHIEPEWYFLAPYAVLRAVPSKLGGVVILCLFVLVIFLLPFSQKPVARGVQFNAVFQLLFFVWAVSYCVLTFCGSQPVEIPFVFWSRFATFVYFAFFFSTVFFLPSFVKVLG